MNTNEALKGLGLEDKEIQLYTSLLEMGEATVLELAKKSGVKRPTAYVILPLLEAKGYVAKTVRKKKTFFVAQPPSKLITEAEFRLKELKEVVPQLESLLQKGSGKPRIITYEGKEVLDRAYDDVFIVRGHMLYMGNLELFKDAFPHTMKKFNYVTNSPEFTVRGILYETEESRAYVKEFDNEYMHNKFIPESFAPFHMDVGIFGNRTLISSIKKDYFTVSIESDEVSSAFRTIFEMMWLSAKE
jgi:predicted transcriptional regulator